MDNQKTRRHRLENGLCRECGAASRPEKIHCEACARIAADRTARRTRSKEGKEARRRQYAIWKEKGVCVNCGAHQAVAERALCASCLENARIKARNKPRNTSYLMRHYGITREQYNEMLRAQGNCCKICGENQAKQTRELSVDHDHKSGRVRGLLCMSCNSGIGHLKDDPAVVFSAYRYLTGEA